MTGANLHPLSVYMLQRGLQTLHLREAAQKNAQVLAKRLSEHAFVKTNFLSRGLKPPHRPERTTIRYRRPPRL